MHFAEAGALAAPAFFILRRSSVTLFNVDPALSNAFISLVLSLGLGLLVGMQRERTKSRLGGIRTFALITVFGTVCALLGETAGMWIVGAGMLAVALAAMTGNLFSLRAGDGSAGITTEIAMVLMFAVGALLASGPKAIAVVVGAGVAVLLHSKPILHRVVQKLGDDDVRAIMQFALVTLVILPVVPNRTFGPYDVLNPRNVWLMVSLVVGMSLAGYLLYRLLGKAAGIALAGILGGLISSTATTVSYSRRARSGGDGTGIAGIVAVIMIASTVVYGRVMVEISAVAPSLVPIAAGPIGVTGGAAALLAIISWLRASRARDGIGDQKNPSELKSALIFAGLYALVLLGVAAAQQNLGDTGLYAVAAVSGLTDMDSITLSVSRMVHEQKLEASTAWRCIVIAAMSNMVAKLCIIGSVGGNRLLKPLLLLFGINFAVAGAVVLFWPA